MAADDPWTTTRVETELRLAMWTLRRLPGKHHLPAGFKVAWPDVLHDWEAYGWDKATRPRMQATAAQIQAMDTALDWVWSWLAPAPAQAAGMVEDVSNIVLMRAAGLTWETIAEWRLARWIAPRGARGIIPGGNSVRQLRLHFRAGVAHIAQHLGAGAPIAAAEDDARPRREEWGVAVEVAAQGETLGEGTHGPIHARAKWAVVPKRR